MKDNMNEFDEPAEEGIGGNYDTHNQNDEYLMWDYYCQEILILSRLIDDELGEIYKEEALISDLEFSIPFAPLGRTGSRCPLV
jgi:hypothetical protein